ncbi:MAG TPA: M48 family metalloprotease [Gaiellaceae bacterium]
MQRRAVGRDPALTARMIAALFLLVAFYAGIAAAVLAILWWQPGWVAYVFVFGVVALGAAVAHYHGTESLIMRSTRAEFPKPGSEPHLERAIERLAELADLPPPRLAVVATDTPNAFTIGVARSRAIVVVTRGLIATLNPRELQSVLAHELAHIANRDASVLTLVAFPRTLGLTLINDESNAGMLLFVVWPLGLPLWAIGTLLTLTISRYREYGADRGSALLTGEPEQLMSALQKLSERHIPSGDLRLQGAEAFCIVPARARRFELLMDHPPLQKRLAALEEIARALGKPAKDRT